MRTVVIQKVLLVTARGVVFSGHDVNGASHRFVAFGDALPRAPVVGETWNIEGTIRTHPKFGRQVHVTNGTLERPSGGMIVHLLKGPLFPDIGPQTAQALWQRFGEELYDVLARGDRTAIADVIGDTKRAREQIQTLIQGWKTFNARRRFTAGWTVMDLPFASRGACWIATAKRPLPGSARIHTGSWHSPGGVV